MRKLYTVLWYVVWPFFSLFHPCRLAGRERLPSGGGLFCGNHSALNDPLCLMMAVGPKCQLRAMAKAEFMNLPVLGWLLRKVGMFGVERGKSDMGAIKTAIKYLKSGENVLMFPEGTRIKDGVDKHGHDSEAHAGAAMLSVRTGAPLVPVYIPQKKPWFRFTTIVIGEPYHPQVESKRGSAEEYQAIAGDLLKRIYALSEQNP